LLKEFDRYFKELQAVPLSNITEHTHRPVLKKLLEKIAESSNNKIQIIHEEKRSKEGFGAPDFSVKSTEAIIGYIENKKIEEDLDKVLKSPQIKKYRELSQNILLTNYCEWILLKDENVIQRANLFYKTDLDNKKFKIDPLKVQEVQRIIENFLSSPPKNIGKSKLLAEALAVRAKNLKEFLFEDIELTVKQNTQGRIYGLYKTFQENISHELTIEDFSDTFSQMIAYSLFLAKLNAGNDTITLRNAKDFIPASYELIRELVTFIEELQENKDYLNTRWIIQEIISIVNYIDLEAILLDLSFVKQTKLPDEEKELFKKDPYIYFYEDFLKAYDSTIRQRRGVYYTPPPVVSFITRAINDILKNDFGIEEGFADREQITVLDFATGTGTFLRDIISLILDEIPEKSGKKDLIIKDHILKNLYGFEYLIAPYTIAHLKLSQFLKEKSYTLKNNERFEIYLTNTLEPLNPQGSFFLPALSKEAKEAQKIKDKKILVITGNPPYNVKSKNNSDWILEEIKEYKPEDEKNINPLSDDYIKFIRFAHKKMENLDKGVIGIITNNSFINGLIHRKMRNSLLNGFSEIYVINLHGNSNIGETSPDGSKDENVFDIKQGVSISIFAKNSTKQGCRVFYRDLFGKRKDKYKFLAESTIKTAGFEELQIDEFNKEFRSTKWGKERFQDNLSFFSPIGAIKDYGKFWGVTDIFQKYNSGIQTEKDNIAIQFKKEDMDRLLNDFKSLELREISQKYSLTIEKVKSCLGTLRFEKYDKELIKQINYRPFDNRYTYFSSKQGFLGRSRYEIMKHFIRDNNLGLLFLRTLSKEKAKHFGIVNNIVDRHFLDSAADSMSVVPLYLYETEDEFKQRTNKSGGQMGLFAMTEQYQPKRENFKPEFRAFVNNKYGKTYSPEEILGYIYAVMHSPTYREKYLEFLKIDFPRIPFVENTKMFEKLSELGFELVQKHLLEGVKTTHSYTGQGNDIVEKSGNINDPFWIDGKLLINKDQYFDNVTEEVFKFQIGGYYVLEHYLKDRKGRKLTIDEIENIEKVINVLGFTIEQMAKIDALARDWI